MASNDLFSGLFDEQEGEDDAPNTGLLEGVFDDDVETPEPATVSTNEIPDVMGTGHKPDPIDVVTSKHVAGRDVTPQASLTEQLESMWDRSGQSFAQGLGSVGVGLALHLGEGSPKQPEYMIDNNLDTAHMTDVEIAQMAQKFEGKTDEEVRQIRIDDHLARRADFVTAAYQFREWMPEVEAKKTSGALGVLDDAITGMAFFGPTMVAGAVSKKLSIPMAYLQLLPGKYEQYIGEGIDKETSWNTAQAAAAALAVVEGFGTNFQLGKIAGAFKKGTGRGFLKKLVDQVVSNGASEGFEEITQAEIEVIFDVYAANKGKLTWPEMAKKVVSIWKNPDFQKGVGYQGLVGFVGGGGMGAMAQGVSSTAEAVANRGDKRTETTSDGVHLNLPKDDKSNSAEDANPAGRSTVKNLLGVTETGEDVETPGDTDGTTVISDGLQTTPEQRDNQYQANDSVKTIRAELATGRSQEETVSAIAGSEAKIKGLQPFFEDAIEDGDHEGALNIAQMMKTETDKASQNYIKLVENANVQADRTGKPEPAEQSLSEIQTHVEIINAKAKQNVETQIQAIKNQKAEKAQQYIDTIGTTKGLEAELISNSTEESVTDGKITQKAVKLYDSVVKQMKLREVKGDVDYLASTSLDKLIDLKMEAGKRLHSDRVAGADANTMARNNAILAWTDQQIMDRQQYDANQLAIARAQQNERGMKGETNVTPAPKGEKGVKLSPAEEQKAQADRAASFKDTTGKAIDQTQKLEASERGTKARVDTAGTISQVEKDREVVRQQAKTLKKAPAEPTRSQELKENREGKAKRESEVAKQVKQVEGLERPKAPIKKSKAKVADLKKDTTSFVILTSDNANSTQAPPAVNVKNRQALKSKLDELGIDYTVGKSKFEGLDEVPFIIHNMSKAEGKKLSDSLNQTSFIYGKGKEVGLVEGTSVAKGKRAGMKLAPDATDYYTEVNGEKFTMDFDFDNQVELDIEKMQIAPKAAKKAKDLFRSAAIKFKGKVYEGPGHMGTVMQNQELEDALLNPKVELNAFEDGFVDHDGNFVDRETATEMVGKADGEQLYTEDFLEEARIKRIEAKTGLKVETSKTKKNAAKKAKVLEILSKETPLSKLYSKLLKLTGAKIIIVTDIAETQKKYNLPDFSVDNIKKSSGLYRPGDNIYINATGKLTAEMADDLQLTLSHEALHSAIFSMFRVMDKNQYRNAMQRLVNWWDAAERGISGVNLKKEKYYTKLFVETMRSAREGVRQAQYNMDNNLGKNHLVNLDKALQYMEEALTYPFTDPDIANFLNNIDAPPTAFKHSKIKTMWDSLVGHMLKAVGMQVRTGSSLADLKRIADTVLTAEKLPFPETRFSRGTEKVGTGTTTAQVEVWNQEMEEAAENAAPVTIYANAAEASRDTGMTVPEDAMSMWTDDGKVFFVAANIKDQKHFVKKWMHEQVAHQGLRNIFGDNTAMFNRFLDQAYTLFSVKEPALLEEIYQMYELGKRDDKGKLKLTTNDKRVAAEELIAMRSEKMKPITKKGVVSRFKDFLSRWLPAKFVGRLNTFKLNDKDIMNMLSMAREEVMLGNTPYAALLDKAIKKRRPTHRIKGKETLPPFIESDEQYLEWAEEVLRVAPNLKDWYSEHMATVKNNFGPDSDLFMVLLAITSPQADVEVNVQYAIDTYAYLMGKRQTPNSRYPKKLKGRLDKWTSPEQVLKNIESDSNFKVTEFGRALLGDPNATVGDLWMFRIFYGDHASLGKQSESYSVSEITALRHKLHSLAAQMSARHPDDKWTPREMQAALWVYVNAKEQGLDITKVASYESGMNKPSAKYGGKTPVQWLNELVPNMSDGPLTASRFTGLETVPLAPESPLAKKLLTQLSREGSMKLKPVKTQTDVTRYLNAQKKNEYSPVAQIKPKELLAGIKAGTHQAFITTDGQAGFAVLDNGEIQMVFSNSNQKGIGVNMTAEAIAAGGRKVSVNDGFLNQEFFNKTFGFQETNRDQDVVEMELSDEALALYTNKKGKVTPQLVRDHLGGFTGAYTRVAKFSRDARKNLDDVANLSPTDANGEFIKTELDNHSFTGKIHEWRDQAELNINRMTKQMEQQFLEQFGGRKSRVARRLGMGSGFRMNTADTELLQKSMNLYIDSGVGANRAKAEAYHGKLVAKEKDGTITAGERQQLEQLDRMLTLSQEEIAWADENIRPYYQEFLEFAQDHNILDSRVENYVKRLWKMPKEYKDAQISWTGTGASGFKVTPSSGKQRTLDSIIDGWELGMELRTEGVIANLQEYANEIGYVFSNRRFIDYMDGMIDSNGDGVVIEVEEGKKPKDGYIRLVDRGFARVGYDVYARADLAKVINKFADRATHALWDVPIVKGIRKINAVLKSTILSVSMYHHLAGMRSYVIGVKGKGFKINPIAAYRRGLAKIDQQTGFTDPNYKHLGPIVDYLVKEGLTLGKTQDWDEAAIMDSFLEDFLKNRKVPGAKLALEGWQGARRWRRQMTGGLFGRLFAGLKAESAALELGHAIAKMQKKEGRGLTEAELKLEAQKVARLINADFGGLHLKRMGRNPDLQRVGQLVMLAPDWTESNWRTVTGTVPGLNKIISKGMMDNPAPPGMEKVYRGFWRGIAIRGLISVAMANIAVLGVFGDDDDWDDYGEFLAEQFSWKNFYKGKWLDINITPIARRMGMDVREKRRVISLLGHFKDILKMFSPRSLIKHKVSPVVRVGETFLTGTDWKDARFNTLGELIETGQLTQQHGFADDPKPGLNELSTMIALGAYNIRQSIPIFGSEMLTAIQGESEWLPAAARSVGIDVRDIRREPLAEQRYQELRKEVAELDRALEDAKKVGDRRMIVEARKDIKRYKGFNKIKSRIGYTKVQLRPINRQIKDLELKAETDKGLSKTQEKRLDGLYERRNKVFSKFEKVVGR